MNYYYISLDFFNKNEQNRVQYTLIHMMVTSAINTIIVKIRKW